MTKNDFIKVSKSGSSKVILAANAPFYKEHGYHIEEATEEEIKDEFPEYQIEEAPAESEAEPKAKRAYNRKATK